MAHSAVTRTRRATAFRSDDYLIAVEAVRFREPRYHHAAGRKTEAMAATPLMAAPMKLPVAVMSAALAIAV